MPLLYEYRMLEKINVKTNGVLYRAERLKEKDRVLLKIVENPGAESTESFGITLEYKLVQKLSFKGIARYLDIETSHHQSIIIIEDFEGIPLSSYLKNYARNIGVTLKIVIAIAEILEYLYGKDIAHQNLCPANLLINPVTLEVKLVDFSVAGQVSQLKQTADQSEVLQKSLAYISPEQTGRIAAKIDTRSDLYSLGIMLYELLTGTVPFGEKETLSIIHYHIAKNPEAPHTRDPGIPIDLSRITLKLLSKNALERYQSPFGLKTDLQTCLHQWESSGNIIFKNLGQQDYTGKLKTINQFYGRTEELARLKQAFESVKKGGLELVLVEGFSGIGKSSLVHEFKKFVLRNEGIFLEGKFNQLQRNLPYFAFIQAFKEYTDFILTLSQEKVAASRNQILQSVGVNGRVLTEIIPHLEVLIGSQPALPDLESNENQNRFHYVFINFIKCISQKDHPLVIFFDDVHWADAASSNLLKIISTDKDLRHLLFIGAYRENEIAENPTFSATVKEIETGECRIEKIILSILPFETAEEIIREKLEGNLEDNESLSKFVYDKSHGNPFFINTFLNILHAENALVFDFNSSKWSWDISKMNDLKFSEDIVEMMTGRLQKLPPATQEVLKIAACLGYQFNIRLLMIVLQQAQQEIADKLKLAIEEGLVLDKGENFKFTHDRIQQASYSLIRAEDKQNLHLKIGKAFLLNLNDDEKITYIFGIVSQLNVGLGSIVLQKEKDELAALNLNAALKAKSSAAYKTSFEYLQIGIDLLDNQAWENNYGLALQLHTEGAESCFLSGNLTPMEDWIETVLRKAHTVLDQVKVYESRIKFLIAQQNFLGAVQTSLKILALLNTKFPKKPTKIHVIAALVKIRFALAGKSLYHLVNAPEIKNPNSEATIRILSNVGSAVYFAAPSLFPLFVCKAFSQMLKYGNSPYSGVVCASYGVIILGGVGNINTGYELGKIAIQLSDKFEANSYKYQCKFIVNDFLVHWKEHLKNTLEPLRENYLNCLETGNPEFASYSGELYCYNAFFCGKNLNDLSVEMMKYLDDIKQVRQEISLNLHKIHTQAVANLQVLQENPTVLTGAIHNEEEMLPVYHKSHAEPLIFDVYLYKLILSYLFEKYEEAANNTKEAGKRIGSVAASSEVIIFYFYDALTKLALVPSQSAVFRRNSLQKVSVIIKKFRRFSRFAPANCLHRLLLIEAEMCRVTGRLDKAAMLYDEAILTSTKNGYLNDLALACELASKLYFQQQRTFLGRQYLLQSYKFYQQWGALAKIAYMESKYGNEFDEGLDIPAQSTNLATSLNPNDDFYGRRNSKEIDLYSIMKAATAISGEVQLDDLITKLVKIAVENTGAEQGYLILKKDDELFIEAKGSINIEEEVMRHSISVRGNELISEPIVQFVYLTQEHLVIGDAIHHPHFSLDEVIMKKNSKSVLCTPIVHQGEVIGLLYFENDLIIDAFSPDRIELLKILSGQMAVSLQNALNEQKKMNSLMEREKLLEQINLHEQELLKTELEIKEQTINNISAEIHDNIGQTLSFIKLSMNTINVYAPDIAVEKLTEAKILLSKVIQDLRDLAKTFNKDFIHKVGLVSAINQQLQFLQKTGLYSVKLLVEGEESKYESQRELILFRIVQELLNNIVKHAEATIINILMDYQAEKLVITVHDNGKGFDIQDQLFPVGKGLGLSNINSRIRLIAGSVVFDRDMEKGTKVTIEIFKTL